MKQMPVEERNKKISEKLEGLGLNSTNKKIFPIIFDRIYKWSDIDEMNREGELDYYFNSPQVEAKKLVWKDSNLTEIKKHLEKVKEILENAFDKDFSDPEKIKSMIFDYATKEGRGQVLWPLRVALSGKDKSPDPFTLIYILGKSESLERIKRAIKKLW